MDEGKGGWGEYVGIQIYQQMEDILQKIALDGTAITVHRHCDLQKESVQGPISGKSPIWETLTKRIRARVTVGGQCVLLQNSHKIKRFEFFCEAKIIVRITSFQTYFQTPEIFFKNIRNQAPKQQKFPNMDKKNCKIHHVDKSTLIFGFQQLYCVPF